MNVITCIYKQQGLSLELAYSQFLELSLTKNVGNGSKSNSSAFRGTEFSLIIVHGAFGRLHDHR